MHTNLSKKNSYVHHLMQALRDRDLQLNRSNFRKNLEKMGFIFAYEISKTLEYEEEEVQTVLGSKTISISSASIVVMSILRAGLPLQVGLTHLFENAECGFISAYRKSNNDGSYDISSDYITCADLEDKIVILCDPMLATGKSVEASINMLKNFGSPRQIHLVSIIASEQGLENVKTYFPDIQIWVGDIDEELTGKSYIVPGLGDAGDLAFGKKMQN